MWPFLINIEGICVSSFKVDEILSSIGAVLWFMERFDAITLHGTAGLQNDRCTIVAKHLLWRHESFLQSLPVALLAGYANLWLTDILERRKLNFQQI